MKIHNTFIYFLLLSITHSFSTSSFGKSRYAIISAKGRHAEGKYSKGAKLDSRLHMTEERKSSIFDIFGLAKKETPQKPIIPSVVVDSDFTLSYAFAALGSLLIVTSHPILGGLNIFFSSFLAIQAKRIRFVFDEDSFELKNADFGASSEVLLESGENFVVGGANRWRYDTFVNWDFFPNVNTPILVYFKENQTPQEKWDEGPGQLDKIGGGQVHFFPAIANCQQLKEQFKIRSCAKVLDN